MVVPHQFVDFLLALVVFNKLYERCRRQLAALVLVTKKKNAQIS